MIQRLLAKNYRSLRHVEVPLGPLQIFFGPNGVGKSSLLDSLYFLRDCCINGVDEASGRRDHGIGLLWDGAEEEERVEVGITTELASYAVSARFSQSRIDPLVGELLESTAGERLIFRNPGSSKVLLGSEQQERELRQPDHLSLGLALDLAVPPVEPISSINDALQNVYLYRTRRFNFWSIQNRGSEVTLHSWYLSADARNFWAVLRGIHDRRASDPRFATIVRFMRAAFPRWSDVVFDQISPGVVTGSFVEAGRRSPIAASGVSDGYLHMLILLTALFGLAPDRSSTLLFDEPEASLHPEALAVLADAFREASRSWNRQILVATHHPMLLSQFPHEQIFLSRIGPDGNPQLRRVSEMTEITDLLDEYALGSLYMTGSIGTQTLS